MATVLAVIDGSLLRGSTLRGVLINDPDLLRSDPLDELTPDLLTLHLLSSTIMHIAASEEVPRREISLCRRGGVDGITSKSSRVVVQMM